MQLELHFKKSGGGRGYWKRRGKKDRDIFQEKMRDLVCLLCFRNRLFIFPRRTREINVSSKLCLSVSEIVTG